jgi:hypothetical protein
VGTRTADWIIMVSAMLARPQGPRRTCSGRNAVIESSVVKITPTAAKKCC